jgi:hypothetical protein
MILHRACAPRHAFIREIDDVPVLGGVVDFTAVLTDLSDTKTR